MAGFWSYRLVRALLLLVFAVCVSIGEGVLGLAGEPPAAPQVIEPRLVHLRSGGTREWSVFPAEAGDHLEVRFLGEKNRGDMALRLRQQDIKQSWRVMLNGKAVGELIKDENDQILYLPVPAGALKEGENLLRVESPSRVADDIRVGEIWIERRAMVEALRESTLRLRVTEADGRPTPARITIVNSDGSLQALGTKSNQRMAVRAGVVYTSDGESAVGLPAGRYTIYAGRGFEYSLAQAEVEVRAGEIAERSLSIRREVDTGGYVACDTHIHTLTHSGHGDASLAERLITLCGEGIELPIATDHNIHVDYEAEADQLGVRRYFTPVTGNEVTTSLGHFNVFPTTAAARKPDFKQQSWAAIFGEIFGAEGVKVAILNHARDLHGPTRPFGPKLFNALVGENLEGWPMRFNAMEVINSGATQTEALRLIHDWMALLNRGYQVTPIGSSDSHDVSRYIVGQGRTYIRAADGDPGKIDVATAVDHLLAGRVLVSYGLLVEATVNGKYGVGDFVPVNHDEYRVRLRVGAPHWSRASRIELYANGVVLKTIDCAGSGRGEFEITMQRPAHDVHLVAVAIGPGTTSPAWPMAKPYQPTSPEWEGYALGICGPIWIDGDGDGLQTTARGYAEQIVGRCEGDPMRVCDSLKSFDDAVAAQAAHLMRLAGRSLNGCERYGPYLNSWRENERARAEP